MIAISYRREDSTPVAGRLHDRLRAEFGQDNVFMDFDSIPYGVDFREHIKSTLERADVVVAVVGSGWLGGHKEASRRIDDPSDFVRLEIAGALRRGIPVIPILVDDTPMPKPDALPPDMQAFAFRNALILDTGIDFHHHADRLVAGIRQLLKKVATKPTITPEEPKRTQTIDQAEAPPPETKSKDQQDPGESAPADIAPNTLQEESVTEEALSKPTPRLKKSSLTPRALKPAPPSARDAAATEPRKFRWKREHIAMAVGGLAVVAAMCIVMFERKRSNTEARSTSPVSESTPAASTTPVEAAAPTMAPTMPPLQSPETTVAQSTAAPVATETVAANSVANSPPQMLTPYPSVVPEAVHAVTPFVSTVDETEAVRQFVRDFYAALSRHDLDSVVSMFADNVDYQGQGRHDRQYIRNDTRNYFRRWDHIYFEVGDIDISRTRDGDFQVKFNFPFAVGQGYASDKRGISSQVWIVRKDSQGNLQIVSQREKVLATGSETRRHRH
jgi:ketosteroid isomerase-like protein